MLLKKKTKVTVMKKINRKRQFNKNKEKVQYSLIPTILMDTIRDMILQVITALMMTLRKVVLFAIRCTAEKINRKT